MERQRRRSPSPPRRSRQSNEYRDRGRDRDGDERYRNRHQSSRRSASPVRRRREEEDPRYQLPRRRDWEEGRRGRHRSRSPQRSRIPPAVGSLYRGRVHTVKPFGVFVALEGFDRHGLVHHTQVSEDANLDKDDADEDKIAALEYFCPRNSEVWVKILEVQEDASGTPRINCSMKAVDQESGKDLDPENQMTTQRRGGGMSAREGPVSEEPPELGSVHRATIASLRPFGAFVRLEGFRSNGLIHFSQISDHLEVDREASDEEKTATIGSVLSVRETVWVKVVEIKEADPGSDRGPKIGCSIKLVSQKDGRDLDPHSLKYKPRQMEGGSGSKPLVGAAAGQAQQGVVDWGYLNADKVNMDPKYTDYELLGEEAEKIEGGVAPGNLGLDGGGPPAGGQKTDRGVTSIEEALAIVKKHERKKKKKDKDKDKKRSKAKKKRKDKEDKKGDKAKKKKKKQSQHDSSSSSSYSD